jgi:copper chaperone CopZ
MERRSFLGLATLTSLAAAPLVRLRTKAEQTARFRVLGFTCPTCAIGLETLLKRQPAVLRALASSPEGYSTVTYDPARTSVAAIQGRIEQMGFHATELSPSKTQEQG